MKTYVLDYDVNNFECVKTVEDVTADFYQMFDGKKLKDSWNIKEIERMHPEEGRSLGDVAYFIIPILSKKALDTLMPLMKDDIEVLPFKFEDSYLYGINVITVLDNVIDYDLSEYETFSDGKRIMYFEKYAFKKDIAISQNIFKISEEKSNDVFVSEKFVNVINDKGLEGFKLELCK